MIELGRRCWGYTRSHGRMLALAAGATVAWSALAAGPALGTYKFVRSWGKEGSHKGQFIVPWGVALDHHGHLYVTDRGNRRIEEFTERGHFIRQWSHNLRSPNGDAVDAAGNVFVADSERIGVIEFSPTGHLIRQWLGGSPVLPAFVATFGNSVWYSGVFNVGRGDTTFRHGFVAPLGPGKQIAYGSIPWGIAFGSAGQIYIARPYADDVLEYNRQGIQLHAWGAKGKLPGYLGSPSGIAVDRWGNVYVTEGDNNRISKFTSTGAVVLATVGSEGKGKGKLKGPLGIAVDDSGKVFVADSDNDRIEEFAPVFPQTHIDLRPANPDNATNVFFSFHANAAGMTFQCKFDSRPWTDCTAKSGYTGAGKFFVGHVANGRHTFDVRATDGAGNTDPTPAKTSWVADSTAPKVTAPGVTLRTGLQATLTEVPVHLAWTGSDNLTKESQLAFELQKRKGTPAAWGNWTTVEGSVGYLVAPGLESYDTLVAPSSAVYHEYRAQDSDKAGNVTVGAPGSAFRALVYQDDDPAVTYTGQWTTFTSAQFPPAFGSTAHLATAAGARAKLTFHGTSIALISDTSTGNGPGRVCIDPGTPKQSCSNYGPTPTEQDRTVVFARNGLDGTTSHTIVVRDESGLVAVDGFVVLR